MKRSLFLFVLLVCLTATAVLSSFASRKRGFFDFYNRAHFGKDFLNTAVGHCVWTNRLARR